LIVVRFVMGLLSPRNSLLQNVRSMNRSPKKVLVSRMGNSWIFLEAQ